MPEIKDEKGAGSGEDGQYLGEDLARDVLVDPSFQRLTGGEPLDDVAAENEIVTRIMTMLKAQGVPDSTPDGYSQESLARDFAEVIVDSLDPSLRTGVVLTNLDLRPYFDALQGKKIVHREDRFLAPDTSTTRVLDTTQWAEAEQERLRNQLSLQYSNSPLSIEQRNARIDEQLAYVPGRASSVPDVQAIADDNAGPGSTNDTANSRFGDVLDSAGNPIQANRFPVDELRAFIQVNGVAGLESLVDQEAAWAQELGGGIFPITTESGPAPVEWGDTTSRSDRTMAPTTKTVSAAQARNMLSTLTEAETRDVQNKLAAAGYFDQVEGGISYVPGDQFDPATRAAWDLMLADSIQQNKPITTMMGEKAKTYRNEVRKSRMAALTESDPRMTKLIADDWAMATIGRALYQEEADALQAQMMELARKRSTFVAGARDNESSTGLQGDYGFTQDDMQVQLADTFQTEETDVAWGSLTYSLNKLMGD